MFSRRKFNELIGASLIVGMTKRCQASKSIQPNISVLQNVVISTWNNAKANTKALDKLNTNKMDLLDAVVHGINHVEADPEDQSVGYGGRPDRDGHVTLDACIMNKDGEAGAVTYLKGYKHAISVAKKVLEDTPHVILSGEGAANFARDSGFQSENLLTEKSEQAYRAWCKEKKYQPKVNIERHDTIGMLVQNDLGDLSGGCSTSGLAYKMAGRVGDSPIIGAGLFVDNEIGACTATGLGELVLVNCSSFLVVEFMRQGLSPKEACQQAVERIISKNSSKDAQVGLIALNKKGEYGAYSIQSGFVYAVTTTNGTQVLTADSYYK